MKLNEIKNEDCFEYLRSLKDNSIDCIVIDPPYNVLKCDWDRFENEEHFKYFTITYLQEFYRVLKDNTACYVFFSQKYMHLFYSLIRKTKFKEVNRTLIWHHKNKLNPTGKSYLYSYDPIFFLTKGNPKFNASFSNKENVDVFEYAIPQTNFIKDKKLHICQKPLELIKTLIIPTTIENDIVLDCFMGSGTTAIASLELNRKFLGCEANKEYFDIANNRIENLLKKQNEMLFNIY
jgi:DNA modification methylase